LPETEIDFLEVADEFEASAGKWKAGDAARALRFYQRAISTYDDGLKRYPRSFDLAYNKALLLYKITQEKNILSQMGSLLGVLKEALDAHRYALVIDQENADVLFNTAQVLTSFAEELQDEADDGSDVKAQSVSLLQEAVELFNSCLTRQEMEFSEMQELMNGAEDTPSNEDVTLSEFPQPSSELADEPEEWATVKEPVTPNSLIETALAQLGSLSSLANIAAPAPSSFLANLSEIAYPLIATKLPAYTALLPTSVSRDPKESDATPFLSVSTSNSTFHANQALVNSNPQASARVETALAIAVFTAAIAGAEYQSQLIETSAYRERITQAFESLSHLAGSEVYPENSHIQLLSAYADTLIEFAENIAEMDEQGQDPDSLSFRWTALETAQGQLTQITSKLSNTALADPTIPSKAQIYFTRANVELLRRRLALAPSASSTLKANEKVLLKNAGVYYRGAAALAKQDGNSELDNDANSRNRVIHAIEQGEVGHSAKAVKKFLISAFGNDDSAAVDEMLQEGLLVNDE
jgi:tetratricopeptide (TPR) repeat protein